MSYPLAACALIWNSDYTKFVGISRRNDPTNMNLPGGKADEGESLDKTCLREIHEELSFPALGTTVSGLPPVSVELHSLNPFFSDKCYGETTYHVATFVSRTTFDVLPSAKEEGFITRWITWEDLCQPSNSFHVYNKDLRDRWLLKSFTETLYLFPAPSPGIGSTCTENSCVTTLSGEASRQGFIRRTQDPNTFETFFLRLVSSPSEARFLARPLLHTVEVFDKRLGIQLEGYRELEKAVLLTKKYEDSLEKFSTEVEKAFREKIVSLGRCFAKDLTGSEYNILTKDSFSGLINPLSVSDKLVELAQKLRTEYESKVLNKWKVDES